MAMRRQRFAPADGLTIRDPIADTQRKGNIMNPHRWNTGIGKMGPSNVGTADSAMDVKPPGSTQRRYPVR